MSRHISRRALLKGSLSLGFAFCHDSRSFAFMSPRGARTRRYDQSSTAEQVTEGIDLSDRTALITGCSSGIGQETLRVLVLRGARVYGLAPTLQKAESGCAAARAPGVRGEAIPLACDHTDFASIVSCAETVRSLGASLDTVICNAGINLQHLEQVNGIEKDFVVNHLGHFILVNRLLPLMTHDRESRIIVVGSGASVYATAGIEFDNLSGERGYEFMRMYGQSKLANGLFGRQLAHRLKHTLSTANIDTPGVVDTPMNRNLAGSSVIPADFDFKKLKSVAQGAATNCYVASSPELNGVSGQYFEDCRRVSPEPHMLDDALAARLWKVSEGLTRPYLLPA